MLVHLSVIASSLERKLLILALALNSSAIFLPWMTESYISSNRSISTPDLRFPIEIRINVYTLSLWSFMTMHESETRLLRFESFDVIVQGSTNLPFTVIVHECETCLFEKSWFQEPLKYMPYHHPIWAGLYNGWCLVFALQILTMIYSVIYLQDWKVSRTIRENHPSWLLILPLATILTALYQLFIQREIFYHDDLRSYTSQISIGFWIAVLSLAIILVTVLMASDQSPLKKIPKSLRKMRKRTWLAIIIMSMMAFFIVEELEFQGGATKVMLVVNMKDSREIHANPELWESHFRKITLIANLFRARVIYNYPEYAYCRLVVPVVSYQVLMTILNNIGYSAGEPVFLQMLQGSAFE